MCIVVTICNTGSSLPHVSYIEFLSIICNLEMHATCVEYESTIS